MTKLNIKYLHFVCLLLLFCPLFSCSPLYIMRAGWEEAKILSNRETIDEKLQEPNIDPELKKKLQLVTQARSYAKQLEMVPGGSFSSYSDIGRDVLVWVLSACPKTTLAQKTWWFPVVGRLPYKGFFELEDAKKEASSLKEDNFDVFLRTSAAFSTLGWFDDPLLSTITALPTHTVVETVFHEICHNTVWINNNGSFNETLASFVGMQAASLFFRSLNTEDGATWANIIENNLHDALLFSRHLRRLVSDLKVLLHPKDRKIKDSIETSVLIKQRDALYAEARAKWEKDAIPKLKGTRYQKAFQTANNALLVAEQVYYDRLELFMCLFVRRGNDLSAFLEDMKRIAEASSINEPYKELENLIKSTPAHCNILEIGRAHD